jgi:hypothetical protein
MKSWRTTTFVTLVAMVGVLATPPALAQVPPHMPGTICFTQFFWCWAQPPGPVGTPCVCPSMNGWVPGIRG